jgi:hypothetical protein
MCSHGCVMLGGRRLPREPRHMIDTNGHGDRLRPYILEPDAAARVVACMLGESPTPEHAGPRRTIAGYEVIETLGRGASASVHLAVRSGSSRLLAIKHFYEPLGPQCFTQVCRELDLVARVDSRSVPQSIDYGVDSKERAYIVREYVEGIPLDQLRQSRPIGRAAKLDLLIKLAEVVQQVHDRTVIHGDIKPQNIIVRPDGTPVLVDFGLASLSPAPGEAARHHDGTPAYMAPEVADRTRGGHCVQSDVYSLGAVAYWLFTGATPIALDHEKGSFRAQLQTGELRHPRELDQSLDADLAAVLFRSVSRELHERTPSAHAFAHDLTAVKQGAPLRWNRPSRYRLLRYWIRTHRAMAAAMAIALLALVTAALAGGIAFSQADLARERRQVADERAAIVEAWEQWHSDTYVPSVIERAQVVLDLADDLTKHAVENDPEWAATLDRLERLRRRFTSTEAQREGTDE